MKERFLRRNHDTTSRERFPTKKVLASTLAGLALAGCGVEQVTAQPPAPEQTTSRETNSTPEKTLQNQAVEFANEMLGKLPTDNSTPIEQTTDANETYTAFAVQNNGDAPTGKDPAITAVLDPYLKTLDVEGSIKSDRGMVRRLDVTFQFTDNNPVFNDTGKAQVTAQDFKTVLSNPATFELTRYTLNDNTLSTPNIVIAFQDGKIKKINETPLSEAPQSHLQTAIDKEKFEDIRKAISGQ